MTRPPILRLNLDPEDIIADNFAGGGGASTGIEWALGRSPDIAINHDPEALAMHAANHPSSRHFCENIWQVDPALATGGRKVALAWFSPDCKHFSKSKGGKPVDKKIRALAWVVVRWAKAVRPRVICLENVEEFKDWGPLLRTNKPDPKRKGYTFRRWCRKLEGYGYKLEWRELRACDYGAPTRRKRLVIVARSDGQRIVWPEPTHFEPRTLQAAPEARNWRTAGECIDFSLPCPSIFLTRKEARSQGLNVIRPLSDKTLRRIARGLDKYVLRTAHPFIIPVTHAGDYRIHGIHEPLPTVTGAHRGELALVAPTLIQTSWGERKGQAPRVLDLHEPLGTICAGGIKHSLVAAFLAKHYGGHGSPGVPLSRPISTVTTKDHHHLVTSHLVHLKGSCQDGKPLSEPLPTILAGGNHLGEVRAMLMKYYGTDQAPQLDEPLHTITTKDRFALVMVMIGGEPYVIVDIGMRMLTPRELFRCQGFDESYQISPVFDGEPLTKEAQVRMVGNSVCPPLAAAIVRAQFGLADDERTAA